MKSTVMLAFFLLHLTFSAFAGKPVAPISVEGTTRVSAEEALELILVNPKTIIIDSRQTEEFTKGHIEGAINLLDIETTTKSLYKLTQKKDIPLLFYCNGENCLRSSNAAKTAVDAGYKKVYWFRGGWIEWIKRKMPIEK